MNTNVPIIGSGKETAAPLKNFAKKERVDVPSGILSGMNVQIPPIYYWEDVNADKTSSLMTMAFQMFGRQFGMSYSIEDQNFVKIEMLRKRLFAVVKESLDVLVHHGEQVLDAFGNINLTAVNEQEAIRWRYDKNWDKKVAAFNKLVRVAPITKEKAIKMKLINA
ncbi:MAG: hypothetical protein AAB782_01470 [Patescibacteria group bacterium]